MSESTDLFGRGFPLLAPRTTPESLTRLRVPTASVQSVRVRDEIQINKVQEAQRPVIGVETSNGIGGTFAVLVP